MNWLVAILLCLQACIFAGNNTVEFELNGLKRKYIIHVPEPDGAPKPLVLFLHGAGGSAESASENYGWVNKADRESFVVAFPEATPLDTSQPAVFKTNPNLWNDGTQREKKDVDDIAFLRKVIVDISSHYPIDVNRIYVTGFSNGASMTFRAGLEMSDVLAAIAPVSGHLFEDHLKPERPMSLLLITGTADPLNPINGGPSISPWGKGYQKPPMINSVLTWLKFINVSPSQKKEKSARGVTTTTYGPNSQGLVAIYIVITGQGHEWPGGKRNFPKKFTGPSVDFFNATDAVWDFFKTQAM